MRRLSFVIALASFALLALVTGVVLLGNRSAAQSFDLVGVSAEELEAGGVVLERPMSDDRPSIDAEHASDVAKTRHAPGATVRQVVLARMGYVIGFQDLQLVWVVDFDPDSILPVPPFGPAPMSTDPKDIETIFALVFVDAKTGEVVHSLELSRATPLDE